MKHTMRKQAFVGLVLLMAFRVNAQNKPLYAGTKTPYQTPRQQYTPAPEGFAPVFVNYVGRHGARFLTKAGSDEEVLQVLTQADKNHALTTLGKRLLSMTQRFINIQKNNYENITGLGKEEQTGIGNRLFNNYHTAFKGKGLNIIATHKVRTQQSAEALLQAFTTYTGAKEVHVVPDTADVTLRFYDLSPAYQAYKKSPAVQLPVDSLHNDPKTKKAVRAICSRIFTGGFKTDETSLVINLYDLYGGQQSIPVEMKKKGYAKNSIDFGIAFTPAQLQWFSFINGAEDFLEKGAGTDTLGIQVQVATPLLTDFIKTTADVIGNSRQTDAILRFTHAEAISPFATLMGIPQASIPVASVYHYNHTWAAENIIPLSANIQWVIYSNGSTYLLKVLLNEKETSLPVATATWPYYKWDDVKNYYLQKIQHCKTL